MEDNVCQGFPRQPHNNNEIPRKSRDDESFSGSPRVRAADVWGIGRLRSFVHLGQKEQLLTMRALAGPCLLASAVLAVRARNLEKAQYEIGDVGQKAGSELLWQG